MTQKNTVLLTISGNIADNLLEDIARGAKPRTDYIEMGKAFGADLIDYRTAAAQTGLIGKLLQKVAGNNMMLAWACFRQRKNYATIFTDGEQVGLPYALLMRLFGWLGRRPAHLMITHIMSTRSKMLLTSMFGLYTYIDRFLVYSTRQQELICQKWNLPLSRAPFTPFMVDQQFFSAAETEKQPDLPGITDTGIPYICSVGLEFRDYPTLMEAVEGLEDLHIVIAAGSPWSKREDQTKTADIPSNVTVKRFTQKELCQLYHKSEFVVMPLLENDFQAGITAILEAMALEKAIICTETRGQIDVIQEGVTGMYVPPHDPQALRHAIETLLADRPLADKMGKAGRKIIDDEMNLDEYTLRLNRFIKETRQ